MKIAFATDHAGFELAQTLKEFVLQLGHEVIDFGAYNYEPDDDYPDFIKKAARAVSNGEVDFGIVLGGSGHGEAMCANRVKGVRAIVFYGCLDKASPDSLGVKLNIVQAGREHNDANVLSIGARFTTPDEAKKAIEIFVNTPFSNQEKHKRRILKLDEEPC